MPGPGRRGRVVLLLLTGLLFGLPAVGAAHVRTTSGPYRLTLGWGVEPTISGAQNFVGVVVADASGRPVAVPAGALDVGVSYGDAHRSLPLVPSEQPGELRAALVPTQPGTYAFHVTGTVRGRVVDVRATCSQSTFDCVTPASEVQFPTREPSRDEAAQALTRALARADRATDRADSARSLAIVAIAVAAAALGLAVTLGARLRRRRREPT